MQDNDSQKGKPFKLYIDTRANIEARTDNAAGMEAFATDIGQVGIYNGWTWVWGLPSNPYPAQIRLSLTSASAVPSVDVTASGSVNIVPYNGDQLALYSASGSSWINFTVSSGSVAVPATSGSCFDIFAYASGSNIALETANWSSGSARNTALTKQNGVYVKEGDATRRYLGTGRTTTVSGQSEDSDTKRFVWNLYNRRPRRLKRIETTASWSCASAVWRQANAATANKVEIVTGLEEDVLHLALQVSLVPVNASNGYATIGEDSITVQCSEDISSGTGATSSSYWFQTGAVLDKVPSTGYHYYAWLETENGTSVVFYGANNVGNTGPSYNGGMEGFIWA